MLTIKTLSSVVGYTIDTYGTFTPDEMLPEEDFQQSDDNPTPLDWDDFDHAAYVASLGNRCAEVLEQEFKNDPVIKSVTCTGSSSPREYNFSTDTADLDIVVDFDELVRQINSDLSGFESFVHEAFTPQDGFMPFATNDPDQFIKELKDIDVESKDWNMQAGAALNWYMHKQLSDDDYMDQMYDLLHELVLNSFTGGTNNEAR